MMAVLSPRARRRRGWGRLFLAASAASLGFGGGAWATSEELRDLSRTRIDSWSRTAARGLADRLYDLAGAPAAATVVSTPLAGGPAPPALKIQVTEAWAAPGSRMPMPPEGLNSIRL